jgi:diguanylate cyclase (GGDEF)-like protein
MSVSGENLGDIWTQNLSISLTLNKQMAVLWFVADNRQEYLGDTLGFLGLTKSELPQNRDDFLRRINPQDVVERNLIISQALANTEHIFKNAPTAHLPGSSFQCRYKLRKQDGSCVDVVEHGTINRHQSNFVVQSLLSIEHQKSSPFDGAIKSEFTSNLVPLKLKEAGAISGRSRTLDLLEKTLGAKGSQTELGVLLVVGIDRFALINEAYGAACADQLLELVEDRFQQILPEGSHISRVSGDLFALSNASMPQAKMDECAQTIIKFFMDHPFLVEGNVIPIMVSIGGVALCDTLIKPSLYLSRGEMALQQAKASGRACYVRYSDHMSSDAIGFKDMLEIGDEFLNGFKDGRVKLAYQPIVDAKSHKVQSYECLIRLIDKTGCVIPAGQFIMAVEKMGLTRLVDNFCSRQAIQDLIDYPTLNLSINISNHTFIDNDWLSFMEQSLRERPEVASRLMVEITESVAMRDVNLTLRVCRTLQNLGCKMAIDDFGAGQTSFTQLRDLSIDVVKIDKSFVQDLDKGENVLFIQALQSLASGLSLKTVAEGAETLGVAHVLKSCGIDLIQGYVFGKPSLDKPWLTQTEMADPKTSAIKHA